MRSVVLLALTLFLVALGLKQKLVVPEVVGEELTLGARTDQPSAQSVHIFSTGASMQVPVYGGIRMLAGFRVGSKIFRAEEPRPGLLVLSISEDGTLSDLGHYDIRNSQDEAIELLELLGQLPLHTVVLMAGHKRIGIHTGAEGLYGQKALSLFRNLGAESDPTTVGNQSFAYICLRTEDGYIPLAEKFSTTRGVHLPYLIPTDRSKLLQIEPMRLRDRSVPRDLQLADAICEGFAVGGLKKFNFRSFRHLGGKVSAGKPVLARWELDPEIYGSDKNQPRNFFALVAVNWVDVKDFIGVRLLLRVNDVDVGSRFVLKESGETRNWVEWDETIPDMAEDVLSVTIEAQWIGDGAGATRVHVAEIMLTSSGN